MRIDPPPVFNDCSGENQFPDDNFSVIYFFFFQLKIKHAES